jgi:hypothetical protein
MRKITATLACPLLSLVLAGCSADAPPAGTPPPPAVVQAAPPTGKLSKAERAAQKKNEKKRALKQETMVRRDVMVMPGAR